MSFNEENMLNKEGGAKKISGATLWRVIKMMFSFYPVMMPVVVGCILFNAVVSAVPSVFMQKVIAVVEESWHAGDWQAVSGVIFSFVMSSTPARGTLTMARPVFPSAALTDAAARTPL